MITEAFAKSLLEEKGISFLSLKRTELGHHDVFEVRCSDGLFFLKLSNEDRWGEISLREKNFVDYVSQNHISFPAVRSMTRFQNGNVFALFYPGLPGRPIQTEKAFSPLVFSKMGNDVAELHKSSVNASGLIEDQLRHRLSEIRRFLCDFSYFIDPSLARSALSNLSAIFNQIKGVVHPCLIHGDISFANTLVDQGRVSGYIDYEWSRFDDPAADFAFTFLWFRGNNLFPNDLIESYQREFLYPLFWERALFHCVYISLLRVSNATRNQRIYPYLLSSTASLLRCAAEGDNVAVWIKEGRQDD